MGGWRGEEEDEGTKRALLLCCCAEIREQALVCLQIEVSKWRAAHDADGSIGGEQERRGLWIGFEDGKGFRRLGAGRAPRHLRRNLRVGGVVDKYWGVLGVAS